MSYTPTSWNTGDTVTAAAMNKIENGIANAGGALICTVEPIDGLMSLNKTVQEIYDALIGGTPVYALYQYGILGTDFSGSIYLAPVVKIYNYMNTDVIRVCVQKPTYLGAKGGHYYTHTPSVALFTASGLNQYPSFDTTIMIPAANVDASSDLG